MTALPAPATLNIGSVIADTYVIDRVLGRGGMGAVYRATHNRLPGKQVAIKVLHAEQPSAELLARFKREAHIASMLAHPNIVGVEDYNVMPDGRPYLVLEYLPGETLAQRLTRGPVTLEVTRTLVRQIGSALAVAHAKQIVHRDLKPQNIFLVPTEVDGRVIETAKVLDFGISKIQDSQTLQTEEHVLLGTPSYMAPEQATGQHALIDPRTDVFSLATIVYEMLSGRPAFPGSSIPEIVFKVVYEQPPALPPHVPDSVAAAIVRATAKSSADRFETMSGFIEALTGRPLAVADQVTPAATDAAFAPTMDSARRVTAPTVATVPGVTVPGVTSPGVATPRAGRRRMLIVAGVGVALAAIAATVLVLVFRPGATTPQLDAEHMSAVATKLMAGDRTIDVDGKPFRVVEVGHQLKTVRFAIGEHRYEAIEQNPEKQSHWAKLARDGHRVVHFRDQLTRRYLAVVVDGTVEQIDLEIAPDP